MSELTISEIRLAVGAFYGGRGNAIEQFDTWFNTVQNFAWQLGYNAGYDDAVFDEDELTPNPYGVS